MKSDVKRAVRAFHEALWRDHGAKSLTYVEDEDGVFDIVSDDEIEFEIVPIDGDDHGDIEMLPPTLHSSRPDVCGREMQLTGLDFPFGAVLQQIKRARRG